MNSSQSAILGAAVGAGVLLGAAGLFLWNQIQESRRRMLFKQEISRLDITINQLKAELESARLKSEKSRRNSPTRSLRSYKSVKSGFLSSYDSEEDEFFDLSSGGDDEFPENDNDLSSALNEELQELFNNIDSLLQTGTAENRREAYAKLTSYIVKHKPCAAVLWRLAKCCHGMSSASAASADLSGKKQFILEGLEHAKRALELDSNDAEAHKWFAVLTGAYGDFLGMKERIEGGYVFKTHVEKAITLRPDDASLRHLVGRFKYEVANLSWMERKIAGALFAELPPATLPEAVEDFKAASKLSSKPWKENSLYLAKCLIAQGNYSEAVRWLDDAESIPVTSCEDELAELEVQSLLSTYSGYRNND